MRKEQLSRLRVFSKHANLWKNTGCSFSSLVIQDSEFNLFNICHDYSETMINYSVWAISNNFQAFSCYVQKICGDDDTAPLSPVIIHRKLSPTIGDAYYRKFMISVKLQLIISLLVCWGKNNFYSFLIDF
jgi:hypothetical protein